jgi:hypothetical protein
MLAENYNDVAVTTLHPRTPSARNPSQRPAHHPAHQGGHQGNGGGICDTTATLAEAEPADKAKLY